MSPIQIAERLAALDWSECSSTHQLAVSAAVETLKGLATIIDEPMTAIEAAIGVAYRLDGKAIDASEIVTFAPEPPKIVLFPVKTRTCWTTLCHLDGREWARSSHFGPAGAWSWIVETVTHEHGCNEDDVHCAESDEYDGDDLVTVDGLPLYRIRHLSTP